MYESYDLSYMLFFMFVRKGKNDSPHFALRLNLLIVLEGAASLGNDSYGAHFVFCTESTLRKQEKEHLSCEKH